MQCLPIHSAYGHRTCLMTFDLTQLLFLADCDIVYAACKTSLQHSQRLSPDDMT